MFSVYSMLSEVTVSHTSDSKCGVFCIPIAPESCEELRSLLSGKSVEEQLLVVEKIQKCNHPSLAAGNKAKLEVRWCKCVWGLGRSGWPLAWA